MKILALDPATNCGWAVGSKDERYIGGTWDCSVKRDESGGFRLLKLKANLVRTLQDFGVTVVVFEAVRMASKRTHAHAMIVQSELQGVIKTVLDEWEPRIPYKGLSSSEIKKHASGNGQCNKERMLSLARAKWGMDAIVDDNQADAMWLLDLAIARYAV